MAWTERYCSVSGGGAHDGTTAADAWTLAEAITNATAGHRVNVIAGTYANTTTSRVFAATGTTTAPIWWRGYNTTIGDIDTNNALTKPAITFTTGQFSVTGPHQIFSNLNISGATTTTSGLAVNSSAGVPCWFDRCRFENTAANSASRAYTSNGHCILSRCWFKATSTAAIVLAHTGGVGMILGCSITGGGVGISNAGLAGTYKSNVIRSCGSHGFEYTAAASGGVCIEGNTIYGNSGDGVRFTAIPTANTLIANNLITNNGGYGINNSTGANTNLIKRIGNDFRSNTSGNENGFGDSPSLSELSESSDPYNNAGAADFSLVIGAGAKAGGQPGAFENETYTSYLDVGAVQRQEPSGGGGGISPIGLGSQVIRAAI